MIDVPALCDTLIQSVTEHSPYRYEMGNYQYISQYRTIGANLPRQVGKTTALLSLAKKHCSLMFVTNTRFADSVGLPNVKSAGTINSLARSLIGTRYDKLGLKYSMFLLDEPDLFRANEIVDLGYLLRECEILNLLADDFFILSLGTKVR